MYIFGSIKFIIEISLSKRTKIFLPLLLIARGPPESPLQAPTSPAPLVQMLVDCTRVGKKLVAQSMLLITLRWLN